MPVINDGFGNGKRKTFTSGLLPLSKQSQNSERKRGGDWGCGLISLRFVALVMAIESRPMK